MKGQQSQNAVGVILAGGLSRRMEGPEKSLLPLNGVPMIRLICNRLQTQVDTVVINANGEPERFAFLGQPIQADTVEGFAGPLAGILAGMRWTQANKPHVRRIVTAAADTPFFPKNLVGTFENHQEQLSQEQQDCTICLAYSNGNRHPVFGSWPIALADALEHFLIMENERKVMLFVQRYNFLKVDFPMIELPDESIDPFFNINTPEDFTLAESINRELSL